GMPTYGTLAQTRMRPWHCAYVVAWQFCTTPSNYARLLRRLQARRCGETGEHLWKTAEVGHRIPLFRVWSAHQRARWPELVGYWGLPNLQVINRDAHTAKCANEARDPALRAITSQNSHSRASVRNAAILLALTTAVGLRRCAPRWRWPSSAPPAPPIAYLS